jgi:uncharacterized protein YidB (DUF937 family)
MGLLDSLLGGGPPGQSGLSAATKALLLVLAAKAAEDYLAHRQTGPGAAPAAAPGGILGGLLGGAQGGGSQGGDALGQILGAGGLGGLLAASGASGALGSLVDLFHQNGHGPAINSWISQGPNQQLEPAQVGQALGPGPLQELEQRTGLPQQTLLEQLARELPAAIDHVTPQGRLPTDAELAATLQARPQT